MVSFILSRFILIPGTIPSNSMKPTLVAGDVVLAYGLAYVINKPQRGDIIVFQTDDTDGEKLIKRIIGVGGDEISFREGCVYVNGELLDEEYLEDGVKTNSPNTYKVPWECYFVLGDNREDSVDSRYWSDPYIDRNEIIGKYWVTILHG